LVERWPRIADKAIRQNEKESHTALEEAKKAEEAAERERLIGIFIMIYLCKFF
jgi:hypothetical protein